MRLKPTSSFAVSCFVLVTACGRQVSLGENDGKSVTDAGHTGKADDPTTGLDAAGFGTGGKNGTGPSRSDLDAAGFGTGGTTGNGTAGPTGSAGTPVTSVPDSAVTVPCDDGSNASASRLISAPYMIQPGDEETLCVQQTASVDLDITALHVDSTDAVGVALARLPASDDAGADGVVPCSALGGSDPIFSAAGTVDAPGISAGLTLPGGTALHVARGERLVLQTRVVDVTAEPHSGTSIVRVTLASGSGVLASAPLPLNLRSAADCAAYAVSLKVPVVLPPGSETDYCVRKTLSTALDVHVVRVDTIPGTHDYQLSVGSPTGPDGLDMCAASTPPQSHLILSSEVGTPRSFLAPGDFSVYHAAAGEQLLYKLDVLNVSSSLLQGTVTVSVR